MEKLISNWNVLRFVYKVDGVTGEWRLGENFEKEIVRITPVDVAICKIKAKAGVRNKVLQS